MVSEEATPDRPATSGTARADALLDEAIDESFPASDPESSWAGVSTPDGSDESDDEAEGSV